MPEINNGDPAQLTTVKSTCSSGCHLGRMRPLVRAVLYAPIVLLAGGYVAVGMFPGLAEYATPLIGESHSSCHGGDDYQVYVECGCPNSHQEQFVNSDHGLPSCCPSSCPVDESDAVDALVALSPSSSIETEAPRDAISAVVETASDTVKTE